MVLSYSSVIAYPIQGVTPILWYNKYNLMGYILYIVFME